MTEKAEFAAASQQQTLIVRHLFDITKRKREFYKFLLFSTN